MKQEQIRDFTRRISQSNRGGLIVVTYEIILAYIADARECYDNDDYEGFHHALSYAQRGLDTLIQSLNFEYEVANNLYALYVFVKEEMAKAVIRKGLDDIERAEAVLVSLHTAFIEAAKQDHSTPLMQNTQQVYAGMTYGRNDLTETFQDPETSRGFFA